MHRVFKNPSDGHSNIERTSCPLPPSSPFRLSVLSLDAVPLMMHPLPHHLLLLRRLPHDAVSDDDQQQVLSSSPRLGKALPAHHSRLSLFACPLIPPAVEKATSPSSPNACWRRGAPESSNTRLLVDDEEQGIGSRALSSTPCVCVCASPVHMRHAILDIKQNPLHPLASPLVQAYDSDDVLLLEEEGGMRHQCRRCLHLHAREMQPETWNQRPDPV